MDEQRPDDHDAARGEAPPEDVRIRDLSPAYRRFVRLMQTVHFGRLHDVVIRRGEPVFDPAPRMVRTFRVTGGRAEASRPRLWGGNFHLRAEVLALLAHLEELGDGRILRLDVVHGLPSYFELESVAEAPVGVRP